jgi:hypothetical protein
MAANNFPPQIVHSNFGFFALLTFDFKSKALKGLTLVLWVSLKWAEGLLIWEMNYAKRKRTYFCNPSIIVY